MKQEVKRVDGSNFIYNMSHDNKFNPMNSFYANQNCLATQKEINNRMRRILVDWLIDVHLKYSKYMK